MNDAGTWEMKPRETPHSLPGPTMATTLTTAAKHRKPVASNLVPETADAVTVARDSMIIQPSPHNAPQPTTRFAHRTVHSLSQFRFDLPQCGTHAFGHRMSMDREPAALASLGTLVREAKEVESFGPALAASCTTFARIATELDQTRFAFVELQSELGKPRVEVLQTRRRLAPGLETDHEIIRIPYDNHIAATAVFPPPLDPQVKHIVQEDVREER